MYLKFVLNAYFMYIGVFACTFVHHVHVWCLWGLEEGIRCRGLELQVVVIHHVGSGNQSDLWESSQCS